MSLRSAVRRTPTKESSSLAAIVPDCAEGGLHDEEQNRRRNCSARLRTSEELDSEFEEIFSSVAQAGTSSTAIDAKATATTEAWKLLAASETKTYADQITEFQGKLDMMAECFSGKSQRSSDCDGADRRRGPDSVIKRVRARLHEARGLSSVVHQLNNDVSRRAQTKSQIAAL